MNAYGMILNPKTGEITVIKSENHKVIEIATASKSYTYNPTTERWALTVSRENGFNTNYFETKEEAMKAFDSFFKELAG